MCRGTYRWHFSTCGHNETDIVYCEDYHSLEPTCTGPGVQTSTNRYEFCAKCHARAVANRMDLIPRMPSIRAWVCPAEREERERKVQEAREKYEKRTQEARERSIAGLDTLLDKIKKEGVRKPKRDKDGNLLPVSPNSSLTSDDTERWQARVRDEEDRVRREWQEALTDVGDDYEEEEDADDEGDPDGDKDVDAEGEVDVEEDDDDEDEDYDDDASEEDDSEYEEQERKRTRTRDGYVRRWAQSSQSHQRRRRTQEPLQKRDYPETKTSGLTNSMQSSSLSSMSSPSEPQGSLTYE